MRHSAQGTTALAKNQGAPSHGLKLACMKKNSGDKCNQMFPTRSGNVQHGQLIQEEDSKAPVSL
jgi:hypothetical protein